MSVSAPPGGCRHDGVDSFAHLQRIVKNRADAADLVQEAFIRVFRHRLDFNFESQFSTWVYTIGLNLARDLLRSRARQPESFPLNEVGELTDSEVDDALPEPAPSACEQAENDEWKDALEEAFRRLPDHLREPLLLVSLDGCSRTEVAVRLGCTLKVVETRLYHGRKRLRAELESILNPWRFRAQPVMHQLKPIAL